MFQGPSVEGLLFCDKAGCCKPRKFQLGFSVKPMGPTLERMECRLQLFVCEECAKVTRLEDVGSPVDLMLQSAYVCGLRKVPPPDASTLKLDFHEDWKLAEVKN